MFLSFTHKSKMATKNGGEKNFGGKSPDTLGPIWEYDFRGKFAVYCAHTLRGQKFCTVSEIHKFLRFTQKFKMAAKNVGKGFLAKIGR